MFSGVSSTTSMVCLFIRLLFIPHPLGFTGSGLAYPPEYSGGLIEIIARYRPIQGVGVPIAENGSQGGGMLQIEPDRMRVVAGQEAEGGDPGYSAPGWERSYRRPGRGTEDCRQGGQGFAQAIFQGSQGKVELGTRKWRLTRISWAALSGGGADVAGESPLRGMDDAQGILASPAGRRGHRPAGDCCSAKRPTRRR